MAAMRLYRITTEDGEPEEIGVFRFDGSQIVIEPSLSNLEVNERSLRRFLEIRTADEQGNVYTSDGDPQKWLEGLPLALACSSRIGVVRA